MNFGQSFRLAIKSLTTSKMRALLTMLGIIIGVGAVIVILSEGLPNRRDYSLRIQIEVLFMDERTCRLTFKDVGFGEFFPSTGFQVEKTIHLGGINGQFNSMS